MYIKKKKGFTLTELLVVVIVIGILSAAVLPKFNKVVETRKTTEAEELMAAIRMEQEKRCALDKKYITNFTALSDIVKKSTTKNFQFSLQNSGVTAVSLGRFTYSLRMPSYADGRICCSGTGCALLNKTYADCTALMALPNYEAAPSSCVP